MATAPTEPFCLGFQAKLQRKSTQRRSTRGSRRFVPPETLRLPGDRIIPFLEAQHLIFNRNQMYPVDGIPSHPNGMRFSARSTDGSLLLEQIFFSIGGGFIISEEERAAQSPAKEGVTVPYPFHSAQELLERAEANNITIAELMFANECTRAGSGCAEDVRRRILHIWQVMQACTQRGIEIEGILPGGLNVRRRASRLAERLRNGGSKDPLSPAGLDHGVCHGRERRKRRGWASGHRPYQWCGGGGAGSCALLYGVH